MSNDEELVAAIRAAKVPPDLGGLYSHLKNFLRDHGLDFGDSMKIAHHFEAALIDARVANPESRS